MGSDTPQISQPISSNLAERDIFKDLFADRLSHEETRDFIKKIVKEYLDQTGISEKLESCYTSEKHEIFQKKVEDIVFKTIQLDDSKTKIKQYATEATKEFSETNSWKQKTFWIPTVIAIISVGVAIWALYN